MSTEIEKMVTAAFRRRLQNDGRHLHSSSCIHNLPPEDQIEMRGKTIDWWMKVIGRMPEQITEADWEQEPLIWESAPNPGT